MTAHTQMCSTFGKQKSCEWEKSCNKLNLTIQDKKKETNFIQTNNFSYATGVI